MSQLCRQHLTRRAKFGSFIPSEMLLLVFRADAAHGKILVLHGFIKKAQKTSDEDLTLARKRNREFEP